MFNKMKDFSSIAKGKEMNDTSDFFLSKILPTPVVDKVLSTHKISDHGTLEGVEIVYKLRYKHHLNYTLRTISTVYATTIDFTGYETYGEVKERVE